MELSAVDRAEFLSRCGGPMRRLDGARILLTGGTGFIGRWLVAGLDAARQALGVSCELAVVGRDPHRLADLATGWGAGFHPIVGDVRGFRLPAGWKPTHVVHGAAEIPPAGDGVAALRALDTGMLGTRHVIDAAEGAGRFLLLSSGAVYGRRAAWPVAEDAVSAIDPLDPRQAYHAGKLAAEASLACAARAGAVGGACIARIFTAIGDGLPGDGRYAAGSLLADAVARRPLRIAGDGKAVRGYLHAGDLAVWLWTLLERGAPGTAYNVGTDRPTSVAELAREIAGRLPEPLPIEIAAGAPQGLSADEYLPDIGRARALGLAPWTPLPVAVFRALAANGVPAIHPGNP